MPFRSFLFAVTVPFQAVMSVWMAADMKYAFVEMRTPELATAAISLDKVELCGRALNVGRPSGYVAPATGAVPGVNPMMGGGFSAMHTGPMANLMASMAKTEQTPTNCIALENMLTAEVQNMRPNIPRYWFAVVQA